MNERATWRKLRLSPTNEEGVQTVAALVVEERSLMQTITGAATLVRHSGFTH